MPKTLQLPLLSIALLALIIGCSQSKDERLVELGQQSCDRQAEQNKTIADQTRQLTEMSDDFLTAEVKTRADTIELQRELAAAEADARGDLVMIQKDLLERDSTCRQELAELQRESHAANHTERQSIDRQRENLEEERRQIADERQRAPVIAASVSQVGMILACLLPLLLAGYLLYVLRHSSDNDAAVTELLIEEIVADRPRLLLPETPPAEPRSLPSTETPLAVGADDVEQS